MLPDKNDFSVIPPHNTSLLIEELGAQDPGIWRFLRRTTFFIPGAPGRSMADQLKAGLRFFIRLILCNKVMLPFIFLIVINKSKNFDC